MKNSKTKVLTGKVRFAYANVWHPRSVDGGVEKFGVSLIIPKSDSETIGKIIAAIEAAKQEGRAKLGDKLTADIRTPLRDGDVERPEDEVYKNSYFINANSVYKPEVFDKNVDPIIEQNEFYSGCYGRAIIYFYAFNKGGSKGIACGLEGLQKVADGDYLGVRDRAEDEFTVWEGDC